MASVMALITAGVEPIAPARRNLDAERVARARLMVCEILNDGRSSARGMA